MFVTVSQLLKESNFYIVADRVSDHISRKLRNCLDKLSSRSNNDYVAKLIELEKHESTE